MNVDQPAETSVSDDIAAAIAAQPADTPAPRDDGRNANGTFAPASPTAPAAPGQPAGTPGTGAATPTPSGQPGAAGAAPGVPGAAPAGGVVLDPSKPPQGWRPETKEQWGTIPENIRTEIIRREEDQARGVERLRKYYEPMEQLYGNVAQHAPYFAQIQRDPGEYMQEVIQLEQSLTLGNPAQKLEVMLDIGDKYGIPMRQIINASMNGQLNESLRQAHLMHRTPPPVPPQVARELAELRQLSTSAETMAAETAFNDFIATNPPLFNEEVSEAMEKLIEKGLAETFQEAYDLAIWRNPTWRQQAAAVGNGQQMQQGASQRQAALAAISTPRSAPIVTPQADDGDGSVENDLKKAIAQHLRPGGV